MATATMQDVRQWENKTVIDTRGDKIGKIEDIYFDEQTGQPEWALVNTGMFGLKHNFVPITDAEVAGDTVRVRWDADRVKNAPRIDSDEELSQQEERELARYYGMEYDTERSQTGMPVGTQPQQRSQQSGRDTAMTRSEEEVKVGKARNPSELVRLRKYIVTENVQKTVPVSHEEVRLEREPITDQNRGQAMSGPEIKESMHEETLYKEEPVVEKRVVPKERVSLGKETITEEEQISEKARKERIELERGQGRAADDPERGRR